MSTTRTIPAKFTIRGGDAVTIQAAANAEGGDAKAPRFDMVLNSGKPFDGFGFPCILDMAGARLPVDQRMPILRQHKGELLVGQSDRVEIKNGALLVAGEIYPDVASGAEVLKANARGFRWQASYGIGATAEYEWIDAEKPTVVNGHAFKDGLVIRKWELCEGSFVPIGADNQTSAFCVAAASDARIAIPNRRSKPTMAEPTPATIKELKDAFPEKEDEGFVVEQLLANATLEQANAAYNVVLKARLKAAQEAASKPAPAPAPAAPAKTPRLPVATAAAGTPAPAQTAREQFEALVEAEKAKGKDVFEARIAAAGESITLSHAERQRRRAIHRAFITEANGGREWTPMTAAR